MVVSHQDESLGPRVASEEGGGVESRPRGEVHDGATLPLHHGGEGEARHQHGRVHVHLEQ